MSQPLAMRARTLLKVFACGTALCMGLAVVLAPPSLAQPEGEFAPVDMRRASVAGPLAEPDQGPRPALGESSARFSPEAVWLNGNECAPAAFLPLAEPPVALHDPMLSDVAYGLDEGSLKSWTLTCDGLPLASLVEIDSRTLLYASPDGTIIYVLEVPLSPAEVERVQVALIARGLLDGPARGEFDEATLTALGIHAESFGAHYRFARPALTEAVLRSLEVIE